MRPTVRGTFLAILVSGLVAPVWAASHCGPDGVQASGSIYRICMPKPEDYNGHLIVFAHGFQDAGEPVGIPEDQLKLGLVSLPKIINGLGFGFATNSYSKTGLAVVPAIDDILDLVQIYGAQQGPPEKVFLTGASEGGLITALAVEQHPEVFAGGLAACGPVGDFANQIDYFGDARATFEYFFPGLIPGEPFHPPPSLVQDWEAYYENVVRPAVFAPHNADLLRQWVAVAKLPFDPDHALETQKESVHQVLTYTVLNYEDAVATLGGVPFDNHPRWYRGSDNDWRLNRDVLRVDADTAAIDEMHARYDTTGQLVSPLVTIHTKLDPVIPHMQEWLYVGKTIRSGAFLRQHLHWPIEGYGHCNFTVSEGVTAVALMLFYTGDLDLLSGVIGGVLPETEHAEFDRLAEEHGLDLRAGSPVSP